MSNPVTDSVRARRQAQQAERARQIEGELAKLPHVQEMRAFFASPAGKAAAAELVQAFLLADPPGLADNEIAYWAGAQKVVKWILNTGADVPALVQQQTSNEQG